MKNLKSILNAVLAEAGFLEKPGFATSVDPDDKQMVAIANRMAYQILNHFNWSGLRETLEITMTSATRYPLPADFQSFAPDSFFTESGGFEFPVPEGRYFSCKYGSGDTGGVIRARKYGNALEIPNPSPGEILYLEYVTNVPIKSSANQPKTEFTSDDDVWQLDDELIILGIQQRWGQVKQFPQYAEWRAEFNNKLNEAIGRDTGSRTIGGSSAKGSGKSPYYPLYRSSS